MGTDGPRTLLADAIIAFAGAFCGGLFLGILGRLIDVGMLGLKFAAIFAAVSGCIEFVRFIIRRHGYGEATAHAFADGLGVFLGFAVTQLMFLIVP